MAITFGFFDARQNISGTYDRVYTAEQMTRYFKGLMTDGIILNVGQMMAVSASDGMVIQVGTGRAFLDARWMENDTVLDLTVPDAHAILNRIDIVVARLDYDARLIEIAIKSGTSASVPVAPSIVRNAAYYELELAEINIPAGTTEITQALITDTRSDEAVCGWVTGLITQIDTETFWTQLQAGFEAWFEEIKGQLDEDAAGHLQLEVEDIWGDFATVETTATASQAYKVGEYLVMDGLLYRVTTAIASGGTITPGTNVVQTNVGDEVSNRTLFFPNAAVSAMTGNILVINDSKITADHVLAECVWGNSSYITTDVTWTTAAGSLTLNGTCTTGTTVTITLVKKSN